MQLEAIEDDNSENGVTIANESMQKWESGEGSGI